MKIKPIEYIPNNTPFKQKPKDQEERKREFAEILKRKKKKIDK